MKQPTVVNAAELSARIQKAFSDSKPLTISDAGVENSEQWEETYHLVGKTWAELQFSDFERSNVLLPFVNGKNFPLIFGKLMELQLVTGGYDFDTLEVFFNGWGEYPPPRGLTDSDLGELDCIGKKWIETINANLSSEQVDCIEDFIQWREHIFPQDNTGAKDFLVKLKECRKKREQSR